jgi:hypothetical protein
MKIRILLLFGALLAGCAEPKAHDPIVVGTWQSSSLFIESADIPEGQPGWEYFIATPRSWEKVMGFRSIRTLYKADGSFSAEYRDRRDSVFVTATGTWYTVRDSLYFFQWAPDTFSASYQFAVVDDTLKFNGIVDWERDGLRNDKVTMMQLRWPRPDSLATPPEAPHSFH